MVSLRYPDFTLFAIFPFCFIRQMIETRKTFFLGGGLHFRTSISRQTWGFWRNTWLVMETGASETLKSKQPCGEGGTVEGGQGSTFLGKVKRKWRRVEEREGGKWDLPWEPQSSCDECSKWWSCCPPSPLCCTPLLSSRRVHRAGQSPSKQRWGLHPEPSAWERWWRAARRSPSCSHLRKSKTLNQVIQVEISP